MMPEVVNAKALQPGIATDPAPHPLDVPEGLTGNVAREEELRCLVALEPS